jgi:CheY-like chemotaxis protein
VNKHQPILIAEDNSDDVLLLQLALRKCNCTCQTLVVHAGDDAIQYLKGEGPFTDRAQFPLPGLILLDLHMPRVDGFEVLTWLRGEPNLRHLPVVVLAGCSYLHEVQRAYELGANSFLGKPADPGELATTLKSVIDFWLRPSAAPAPIPLYPAPGAPEAGKGLSGSS